MLSKVNVFITKYKIEIMLDIVMITWIFLFLNGKISINRIIIFILVLCYIVLYRKLREKLDLLDPNKLKNNKILWLLISIDRVKLLLISFIMNLYLFFFYLDNFNINNKVIRQIIKLIKYIIKVLIINPILLILHKYYSILHFWLSASLKVIFIQRFYGIILVVLIFSPLLNYIYVLLGSSFLNIYILVVLISILDDNIEKFKNYKYLYNFICLLKLNKNIYYILEKRNIVSIFSVLIAKALSVTYNRNH